jgi:predicted porin
LGIPAKRTTLNVRYDEFARNNGNAAREANFKTWSLTGEYFFHKKARATFTYQFRDYDADKREGVAKTNGNAVLKQVDNRIGLQVTFIYKNVLLR